MKGTSKGSQNLIHHHLAADGLATRFGEHWPGLRCGAKTRSGSRCLKPALKGKKRCQLHGGMLTFFKTGPFAYDGLFVWWIPFTFFFGWFPVMFFVIRKAILQQQAAGET